MNQFPESVRRRMRSEKPGEHPDADLLTAFSEHLLVGSERERVLLHLAICATCREVVSLATPDQSEAEVVVPIAEPSFRWPILRWTAVAAAVIVVGAAVSVLTPRRHVTDISTPATQTVPRTSAAAEPKSSDVISEKQRAAAAPSKRPAPREELKQHAQSEVANADLKAQPQQNESRSDFGDRDKVAASAAAPAPLREPFDERAGAKAKLGDSDAAKSDGAKKESARKDSPLTDSQIATGALVGAPAGTAANSAQTYQAQANRAQNAPPPPATAAPTAEAVMIRPAAPAAGALRAGSNMEMAKTARVGAASALRWRVSSTGAVERSPDGNTWEEVEIDPGVTFRVTSSRNGELWAGGTAGALFHSVDSGRTWSRVKVGDEGMWVTDTITTVDFPSARTGFVTTDKGAVWTTQDGGRTWQRRQ